MSVSVVGQNRPQAEEHPTKYECFDAASFCLTCKEGGGSFGDLQYKG